MKNQDKKILLFVIATIVTSFGIGHTLLKNTYATFGDITGSITYDVIYISNWPIDGYEEEKINYDVEHVHTVLGDVFTIPFGYSFDGWNTSMDGTGTKYVENDNAFVSNSNLTLYAQWELLETSDVELTKRIVVGTTVNDIKNMMGVIGEYNVYDKDDNLIEDLSMKLKTGDKLKITLKEGTLIYLISVVGDINSDGIITIDDVVLASKHIIKSNVINDSLCVDALDIDNNNVYNINDIIKMVKLIKGV